MGIITESLKPFFFLLFLSFLMQDVAAPGEVTLPDLTVSPSQHIIRPSSTKQLRQDPVGHASTLRQSHAPEGFDTKGAVETPPETPGSSERLNQHPTSESEQRNQGGGAGPQRRTGNKQQLQRPKRSDASGEKEAAGSAVESSLISDSVMDSEFASSSRSDATGTIVQKIVLRETEESSITGAAEDFKPDKDSDLTVPTPYLQSRNTEGSMINVSAIERNETQAMFDRRDAVSPKPQTSPQRADAETEAGEVEGDDVHAPTALENQHYDDVTPVFKNSTQPSSDLSSDLITGDSFFQSNSKSTQQTLVSSYQPPTDTVTRKGTKLRPGVRGQRVRF